MFRYFCVKSYVNVLNLVYETCIKYIYNTWLSIRCFVTTTHLVMCAHYKVMVMTSDISYEAYSVPVSHRDKPWQAGTKDGWLLAACKE